MKHFVSVDHHNIFRLPVGWQYLLNNQLGGTLDATKFANYDQLVQGCLSTGASCIIDIHNYARWNGQIIGQGGPTNAQFASLWSQLATKYKGNSKILFGLMNEPHGMFFLLLPPLFSDIILTPPPPRRPQHHRLGRLRPSCRHRDPQRRRLLQPPPPPRKRLHISRRLYQRRIRGRSLRGQEPRRLNHKLDLRCAQVSRLRQLRHPHRVRYKQHRYRVRTACYLVEDQQQTGDLD
jgi:hypothetical protein